MNKIIILISISGSGKSTWAKNYVKNSEDKSVIVSRDAIRMSLFGLTDVTYDEYYAQPQEVIRKREEIVTNFSTQQIWYALQNGFNVIADNTHLRKCYINMYKVFGVELELVIFDTNLNECKIRQGNRQRHTSEEVILAQNKSLKSLLDTNIINEIDEYNKFVNDIQINFRKEPYSVSKQDAVVVDIDGTVALKGDRGIHDLSKVKLDTPNKGITEIVKVLHEGTTNIIFCSGREDNCREETLAWLNDPKNGIVSSAFPEDQFRNFHLRMRKAGDNRKDWKIKAELWNNIQQDFNIVAMIDDRDQVVHIGRRLGYTMIQVNYGDF